MEHTGEDRDLLVAIALVNEVDAQMAKDALEAEGVECFLADEHASITYAPGIQLQVRRSDEQKAKEILAGRLRESARTSYKVTWLAAVILVASLIVVLATLISFLR